MDNYYAEFEEQLKEEARLNALIAENFGEGQVQWVENNVYSVKL
jgi:hypothetical protein